MAQHTSNTFEFHAGDNRLLVEAYFDNDGELVEVETLLEHEDRSVAIPLKTDELWKRIEIGGGVAFKNLTTLIEEAAKRRGPRGG